MTNQSLRTRFRIEDKNAAIASRIIKDALESGFVKEEDPENKSFAGFMPLPAPFLPPNPFAVCHKCCSFAPRGNIGHRLAMLAHCATQTHTL